MEAAGLLLGALPLALYAMDNYQRCLQVTTDYLRFQSTIKLLRSHIFLQQEQLHMTLRSIGLVKPTPVELEEHLRQRYPDKYDTFVDIIQHMERLLSKLMDKLDIDGEGKPRWTTEAPERASWEWRRVRRSFGRSSRQKLIEELQFWNDALKVCFERSELPLESDVSNPTLAAIKDTFNAQSCVSIRQQAHQVHEALLRSWRCQSHDHQGNLELTWHTDRASKPGDFKILLSYSASSTEAPAQVWQPLRLELQGLSMPPTTPSAIMQPPSLPLSPAINPGRDRRVRLREMFASRSRQAAQSPDLTQTLTRAQAISPAHMRAVADGPFEDMDAPSEVGESSFITQPRNLGDIVMTDIAAPSADPALLERPTDVDCLCSFLHRSTRLGRLRVEGREGLNQACILLRRQEDLHQHVKPIPLRAVLTPPAAPAGIAPVTKLAVSRKDRFAIAAAAAWAVLYLGDSPWISGDWTGKDILHLVTKSQFVLSSFYPSISFSLDRTTGASFSTTSLGAGELRSSLIRNRTIFALGILLVELCLDKSFEQLRHETFTSDIAASLGLGTTPDDYDIANLQVQKVYLEAGDDYGYAVQRCLRCEFPGRDVTKNFRFDHFRRDFFSYVVAPIQATFAMLPSSRFAL